MTLAHLSDTHLGFRAYGRTTPAGYNQREADVMETFTACLNAIAERDPDVVVHSGDLFHVVRPTNATIVAAYHALRDLQRRRGGKPFLLIGGNHDTPRTAESGNILRLFSTLPGVHLAAHAAEVLDFPELDFEALCVPFPALGMGVEYVPTLGRRYSLLTLHGMASQALPDHAQFDVEQTRHDRWSYVALGDYHVFQPYGANVCYSGSTDFTSSNIWEEIKAPKGWVWFDTDRGQLELVPLANRLVIDLPPIDASGLTPEEIEARMRENAVWSPDELPVVRQRIVNVHPRVRGKIPRAPIREFSARALSYQVHIQPPLPDSEEAQCQGGRGISLEQSWEEHVL